MFKRIKIISGIIWIVVFVTALLVIGVVFQPKKYSTGSIFTKISNLLSNKPIYNGTTTQKVVEEESQIIDVVKKVSPSVVSIVIKTTSFDFFNGPVTEESGIGTGFIVDPNGLIVTNSHVVDDPNSEYSIILKDGTTYKVNKIHLDEISDIAILEVTARGLPAVDLGDSDSLQVGQRAIAIGNALGRFQNTVTTGVVSGIARQLQASDAAGNVKVYENAIQTDAALNPGNSGGPLLNSQGQVIGINVATTIGANNLGFAIPINTFKPILASFLRLGRIVRPYLGVSYTLINKEISDLRKLPQGAFIASVISGSPADKAGIRRGDIIIAVNGKSLDMKYTLSDAISERMVGDTLSLTVDRNGKNVSVNVTLVEAPSRSQ